MKRSVWGVSVVIVLFVFLISGTPCQGQAPTDLPQETVECTGWHALCALADDCRIGPISVGTPVANCDCWKVTEQHMVMTSNIKDDTFPFPHMKELTQQVCTKNHPCGVDEAPVCKAIQNLTPSGQWVSTFSYRGWCSKWNPVKCSGLWSDCMTSPCTESQNPRDPNRPLSCKCTLQYGPYVGTTGRCVAQPGTIMSTIPQRTWNFKDKVFSFDVPGDDYVKESCDPLKSDHQ